MSEEATINLVTALWFGSVGACLGSFINVVVYRLPLGLSVVWNASRCPKCGRPIRAWHNVPILGWIWLRGRCYDCGQSISIRYPLVEAIVGAAFFTLAYVELYTGGANLPGGPVARADDALDLFLRPSWTLLGVFAGHCMLVALLACAALVHYDRWTAPPQIGAVGALVSFALVAWVPQSLGTVPAWFRFGPTHPSASTGALDSTRSSSDLSSPVLSSKTAVDTGQASGLLGAALGMPLLCCGVASLVRRREARRWLNGALVVGLAGSSLGATCGLLTLVAFASTLGGRLSVALAGVVAYGVLIG